MGSRITRGIHPVRWFVIDGWCDPKTDWYVPDPSWPSWVHYSNDFERGKRTTTTLPFWADSIVRRLHSIDMNRMCGHEFGIQGLCDSTLHGGGLQVTSPGGFLATHLDLDRHPNPTGSEWLHGIRRVINLIVFANRNEWLPEWGGQLYLADPMGNPVQTFDPLPGRLVAFETNDLAYHGVLPVTGPVERVSVSVSLYSIAGQENTRQRAMFMPVRGK